MTTPENTDTADAVRLYRALGRITRSVRRDASGALVGHGGLSALATLVAEGPQRAGSLADAEGITPPAMTRVLNSLEEQGYVARRTDPLDGRASLVEVTAAGRDLLLAGRAERLHALQARLSALPADERERLMAALPALEALGGG
jgi:DNA-binding MarR family transcriptional regulator